MRLVVRGVRWPVQLEGPEQSLVLQSTNSQRGKVFRTPRGATRTVREPHVWL